MDNLKMQFEELENLSDVFESDNESEKAYLNELNGDDDQNLQKVLKKILRRIHDVDKSV